MCIKYVGVYGECGRKEFWRIRRMHLKNFGVNGEFAYEILSYMENMREYSFFFADLIKPFSIYAKRILADTENMRKEFMRA
jgi:hypothetical protein